MVLSLVYTELMKYKKSIVPWMIVVGGSLPAVTALLSVSTDNPNVKWDMLMGTGLNLMNLLALLLVAVFTGIVFAGEYHGNTASIVFTYPMARSRLYIGKLIVVLLMITVLYLTLLISIVLLGYIYIRSFPSRELWFKFAELTMIMIIMNFVVVPVTALVSIVIKGASTYIVVGMCYVVAFISFSNSNLSIYIPMCVPSKLVQNYLISICLNTADFKCITIISSIVFLSALIVSNIYYSKSDVYK